jgi:hypothetical protein
MTLAKLPEAGREGNAGGRRLAEGPAGGIHERKDLSRRNV